MTTKPIVWIARALGTFVLLVLFGGSVDAGSITVAWDPNSETDLAGYIVYWGTASGVYSNTVYVSNKTSWTLTGLTDGQPYYIAVKAYNVSGLQSLLSNEVSGVPSSTVSTVSCTYSLSASSQSLPASGGTGAFNVSTSTGCTWTSVSSVSWITVAAGASGSGSGTVTYSAASNSSAQRTGTITVAGQGFTITEAAASASATVCTIALNPTVQSVPSSGGTGTLSVTAGVGCSWTTTSNNNWITVTTGASGSGNGTVTYSVSNYNGAKLRFGTLTIAGHTFTVFQAGRKRSVGEAALESFVYTNDNINGPNTVSAFAVDPSGALTPISGSPFATGGIGRGFGRPAVKGITVDPAGRLLFVANYDSSDVSVFSISERGNISLVRGAPFKVPGPAHGDGLSFAVTPDSKFLMAGNSASKDITVFSVGDDGSLSRLSSVALPAGGAPGGMKVSADGAFLAVAMDTAGPVAVFSIGSNGTLAPVPGSPFYGTFVNATDIDISCAGNFVFAANGTINSHTTTTTVDVFSVTRSGILDLVPGSPFQPGVGVNSNVVLLSPDNRFLFSSDQGLGNDGGDTVTVAVVAADGSLTLVPGSPFSIGSGGVPMGIAMDQTGTLLFTANAPGNGSSIASIGVFRVASDGSLTAVTGAPFAVPGSNLSHIATVPAPVCADGTR